MVVRKMHHSGQIKDWSTNDLYMQMIDYCTYDNTSKIYNTQMIKYLYTDD